MQSTRERPSDWRLVAALVLLLCFLASMYTLGGFTTIFRFGCIISPWDSKPPKTSVQPMLKSDAANLFPWRQNLLDPRYWVSWLAGVVLICFVSIAAHRKWGAIAGFATFFTFFMPLPFRMLLETGGKRKHVPPLDSLD